MFQLSLRRCVLVNKVALPAVLVSFFGFLAISAQAQDTYVPQNSDVYHLIDRYQIRYADSIPNFHPGIRPYRRRDVARLTDAVVNTEGLITVPLTGEEQPVVSGNISRADHFNINYLLRDNWQWSAHSTEVNQSKRPVLKHFYRNQTDLFHVDNPEFRLRLNPVLNLQYGQDRDTRNTNTVYVNTRGVQVEGDIGRKVGFYTLLTENQVAFPGFVTDRIARDSVLPGEGFYKPFKHQSGNLPYQNNGYDFFQARGYITAQLIKQIDVQFGHDKNFIGNGHRSLLISDYAAPYFFLKLNTRVWKLHYMNLFAELTSEYGGANNIFPKKYMALHHLSLNITPNLNIGLFESVIFARNKGRFEMQYLNPLIFYRSVEQQLGSRDNALIGMDFRWNLFKTAQLYGQVMLDEFLLSEVKARNGWWANKQAFQLGAKYIDVAGLKNLDIQGELNYIRPYTYTHYAFADDVTANFGNYSHYEQPLAHPIGANLRELVGIIRYQPLPRLMLTAKATQTTYGADTLNASTGELSNYGTNVLIDYNDRENDYGNEVGQGIEVNQLHVNLTATWQLRQNVFLDANLLYRNADAALDVLDRKTTMATLGFRWNIGQRLYEF